jgi:DNA repair photolyase
VAPVLPGLADSPADLKALADRARRCGAREVVVDPMNFYPAARHRMETLIALHRPSALPAWREAASRAVAWRRDVAAITL